MTGSRIVHTAVSVSVCADLQDVWQASAKQSSNLEINKFEIDFMFNFSLSLRGLSNEPYVRTMK